MRIFNFQFSIFKRRNRNSVRGQSLIEMIVAIAVGAILVSSAVLLLFVSTRIGRENRFIQAASFLSQELMDKVTVFADRQWYCPSADATCGIYNLQKGLDNKYSLIGDPLSAFLVSALPGGEDTITLDGVIYVRYFFVENVVRNRCGVGSINTTDSPTNCSSNFGNGGFAEDPSTQKVTAVTTWNSGGGETRIVRYLTRNRNELFHQTDWSGGSGHDTFPAGPNGISKVNDEFESYTNIDFSTVPGSVQIAP